MHTTISPQVWLLQYDPGDQLMPEDRWRFFSDADRKRFSSIRHKDTRTQFALARLLAGSVLEKSYGNQSLQWTIGYERRGRPRLESCFQGLSPHISISHTRGMVSFAISDKGIIGVDVEDCSRNVDIRLLSKEVFSPWETACFERLPAEVQRDFFFQSWTLKEAYTKALGLGLYASFRSIEMQVYGQDTVMLKNPAPDDRHLPQAWQLFHHIFSPSFHVGIAHLDESDQYPRPVKWRISPAELEVAGICRNALHLELK